MEDYRSIELEKQLKEKFPDLKVTVQQIATGNSAANWEWRPPRSSKSATPWQT